MSTSIRGADTILDSSGTPISTGGSGAFPTPVRVASAGADVDISAELEDSDTLDGITLATGDRVLLKDQTSADENGIYVVVASGAASRATDMNEDSELIQGMTVAVAEGTLGAKTLWMLTTAGPYTIDTDNLVFEQTGGSGSQQLPLMFALSDETTALTGGTKLTVRAPFAFTLNDIRGSLTTTSSSGDVVVDVNEGGGSLLSTKLTIDQGDTTSEDATNPPVISDPDIADDAVLTFDIDSAGTSAAGLKVTLFVTPA